jgi:hypothetical protein
MTTMRGIGDSIVSPGWQGALFHGMVPVMDNEITAARLEVAESTKRALLAVALQAYEEAGLSGLCAEGRWEVAIGAMRNYDVRLVTAVT